MKQWRLLDDVGNVVASVPADELLDPVATAQGREGYGVYEALDARGNILYTGRTGNLEQRLASHAAQSPWWGFAREIHWTPCADYAEAVAVERLGISTDQGAWNGTGRVELPTHARTPVPAAIVRRLVALYAATTEHPHGDLDLDNYIATLRSVGWTLSAIAAPLSITRERVRQREARGVVDHDLVVPAPPRKPAREKKVWPTLRPSEVAEMRELQQRAVLVRGLTALDHPNRLASERLTELIVEARLRGVRINEIAQAVGVTAGAIQMRIRRHGYMSNPPSQQAYAPGSGFTNRWGDSTECQRGHRLEGDNVRFINGDASRRRCRECERIYGAVYRARKAGAA